MVVPTPEQLSALVKAADEDDPVLATAIALADLTGARRGELVALRWSDLDLVIGRVRIARSLTVAGGEQHTGPTKTHQSRDLALEPALGVTVLRRRWDYMVALSNEAESPLVEDPYVLSYNADGRHGGQPGHADPRLCGSACSMEKSGGESVWGVIMYGCVLGGRCRSSARAFGAAGVISLTNRADVR